MEEREVERRVLGDGFDGFDGFDLAGASSFSDIIEEVRGFRLLFFLRFGFGVGGKGGEEAAEDVPPRRIRGLTRGEEERVGERILRARVSQSRLFMVRGRRKGFVRKAIAGLGDCEREMKAVIYRMNAYHTSECVTRNTLLCSFSVAFAESA